MKTKTQLKGAKLREALLSTLMISPGDPGRDEIIYKQNGELVLSPRMARRVLKIAEFASKTYTGASQCFAILTDED